MRQLLYLMTALVVLALAVWAYRENYRTQAQIGEMGRIQTQTAALRQQLGILRAEWAYLNRPERLRELVDLNFDRLQLIPLTPDQFIDIPQIGYPDPEAPPPPETDALDDLPLPGDPAQGLVPRPPTRPRP